jgi:hypothetical protein
VAYAGGWKKLEPMWDLLIRAKRATSMLPVLEGVLSGFGEYRPGRVHDVADMMKESEMDRRHRAPLKLVLPLTPQPGHRDALPSLPLGPRIPTAPRPPLPGAGEAQTAPVALSPVHTSPDAPRPRFVPLALAIDLGQAGPIGSLTTTTMEIEPTAPSNVRPPAPARRPPDARRHLRLLPDP